MPSPERIELHLEAGGTRITVAPGATATAGRSASCDLPCPSEDVSRRHAEFLEIDGRWAVRDLGSSNGTWVRGKALQTPMVLSGGEHVQLGGPGGVTVRVRLSAARADADQGDQTHATLAAEEPLATATGPIRLPNAARAPQAMSSTSSTARRFP